MKQSVGIIGAGSYGTALAQVLSKKFNIKLYNNIGSVVDEINEKHTNSAFFGKIKLSPNITASTDVLSARDNQVLIIAVPAQAVRNLSSEICGTLPKELPIVSCSKGIEHGTGMFMSEVIGHYTENPVFILSGPSFATEIIKNMPTQVNLAGEDSLATIELAEKLSTDVFSLKSTKNVIGVQACGAFKNILAIVIGIIRGLNLGSGAESTALTKGIQEISIFLKKITGSNDEILSLSGIGDIVMTCFNSASRNHTLGLKIAKDEVSLPLKAPNLSQIPLAEGALTAQSWPQIINRYEKYCHIETDMPLFSATYALLYEGISLTEMLGQAI